MAILNPNLYAIIFTSLYLIIGFILHANHKNFLYILVFSFSILALYFLCTYYLIPMPLNIEGLHSVFQPKTQIMLIPFKSAINYIETYGLLSYVLYLIPLISAANLVGFAIPLLINYKRIMLPMFFGFFFETIFIFIQIIFRYATGYEGKPIDITDVILYLLFQLVGLLEYFYICKKYPDFKMNVRQLRQNDIEDID